MRRDYKEQRMSALALKAEFLYFVAFVEREDGRRVITLRRANRREVNHYVSKES